MATQISKQPVAYNFLGKFIKMNIDRLYDTMRKEEEGFLTTIAWLRFIVASMLLGSVLVFPEDFVVSFIPPNFLTPTLNSLITLGIVGLYFLGASLLLYKRVTHKDKILKDGWLARGLTKMSWHRGASFVHGRSIDGKGKIFQVLFDLSAVMMILAIHSAVKSELYMMLALPLILAGRSFSFLGFISTLVLVQASLFGWQYLTYQEASPFLIFFSKTFFPRAFILTIIAGFAYLYRMVKRTVLQDKDAWENIVHRHSGFASRLQKMVDTKELCLLICEKAMTITSDIEKCEIYLFDKGSRYLEFKASFPFSPSLALLKRGRSGEDVIGRAFQEKTLQIEDGSSTEQPTIVAAPLYVGDKKIGVIALSGSGLDKFNDLVEMEIQLFAIQASIALANTLEFEQHKQSQRLYQKILLYGQERLRPQDGMTKLLQDVIIGVQKVLGYQDAGVYSFGFIPRDIPNLKLTGQPFDMHHLIHDKSLQQDLQSYIARSTHFRYPRVSKNFSKRPYKYYVPLIGADNYPIGILGIGNTSPLPDTTDISQAIWHYANDVAKEIEVGEFLQRRAKLEKTLAKIEETAEAAADIQTLVNTFVEDLGFQKGMVHLSPYPEDGKPQLKPFNLSDTNIHHIRQKFPMPRGWVRKHTQKLRDYLLTDHIYYFPWQDPWVQTEFNYEALNLPDEQGFLYIEGVMHSEEDKHNRFIFNAVLSVDREMVEPTQSWAEEFEFLVNAMARAVENVRLAVKKEAIKAQAEERRWLRTDIHTVLNIIQGVLLHSGALVQEASQLTNLSVNNNGSPVTTSLIEKLEVIEKACAFAYNDLSQLMHELREPTLRDRGFVSAMEEFINAVNLRDKHHLQIDRRYSDAIEKKDIHILYRIAQEAINNARKHGKIEGKDDGNIEIILKPISSEEWCLEITDNGQGFDKDPKSVMKKLTSFGLIQIKKWAKDIKGNAQIDSELYNGAKVKVLFPSKT